VADNRPRERGPIAPIALRQDGEERNPVTIEHDPSGGVVLDHRAFDAGSCQRIGFVKTFVPPEPSNMVTERVRERLDDIGTNLVRKRSRERALAGPVVAIQDHYLKIIHVSMLSRGEALKL
jgi:hypothetical protein